MVESLALSNKKSHDEIHLLQQQLESYISKESNRPTNTTITVPPITTADHSLPTLSSSVPSSTLSSSPIVSSSVPVIHPLSNIESLLPSLNSVNIGTTSSSSSSSYLSNATDTVTLQQYNQLQDKLNALSAEFHQLSTTTTEANTVLANDLQDLNKYLHSLQFEIDKKQQTNQIHTENLQQRILKQETDYIQRIGKNETQTNQYIQDKFDNLRVLQQQHEQSTQSIVTTLNSQKEEYTKLFNSLDNTARHHKTRLDALAAAVHAFAGVLSIGKNLFGIVPDSNKEGI